MLGIEGMEGRDRCERFYEDMDRRDMFYCSGYSEEEIDDIMSPYYPFYDD